MSYRELRNCAEMLRALGFPRLISLENFRNPNFPLVAEILIWLAKRFDPTVDLPSDIDTEQDRILFVRSMAQYMATKVHVKLNTKKLYQADGFAVQEILKALVLLYSALQSNDTEKNLLEDEGDTTPVFDVSSKISDLKQIRSLASEITGKGATLYGHLKREVDLREIRNNVINRQLEVTDVEVEMQNAIRASETEVKELQAAIGNVGSDENTLDSKIEKKKTGLDRSQKRLVTLKKVRPAFMDEYEKLEADLKKQYEIFINRFMSLSYLEQQMDDHDKTEHQKMMERESATKSMLEKLRSGEGGFASIGLNDSDSDDDDDDDDDGNVDPKKMIRDKEKQQITQEEKKNDKGGRRVFGSMTGGDLDSESLDSDTDLNLDEDGDSDFEGIEGELGRMAGITPGRGSDNKKVKGSRMRGPAAAARGPQDINDF